MKSAVLALALFAGCARPHAPLPRPQDTAGAAAAKCPEPSSTTEVCAAVITYAKSPGGVCCQYPTPCSVPFAGPQYSDESCTAAAGPAPQ